ncbi:MAG: GIY-YIG nuclease family protein [Candidatus Dependentiae bacterium]
MNKSCFVYILECKDGSYYTGQTWDLKRRLSEHQQGAIIDCYTFTRRPVKLVFYEEFPSKDSALAMEHQIKKWSRKKKEALIKRNWQLLPQLSKKKFKKQ